MVWFLVTSTMFSISDKLRFFYYFSSFQTLHQKRLQPVRVPFHLSYLWLQLRVISLDDWQYRFYLHTDIIECNTGSAKCHVNATCGDTIEGYICKCKDNMIGDGFLCVGGCFDRHMLYQEFIFTVSSATVGPCNTTSEAYCRISFTAFLKDEGY